MNLSSKSGFGLVGYLVSIGVLSLSISTMVSMMVSINRSMQSLTARSKLIEVRLNLASYLSNAAYWEKSFMDSRNVSSFKCIVEKNCTQTSSGTFSLVDETGTQVLIGNPSLSTTTGLTPHGLLCDQFSVTGNPDCPIQVQLSWRNVCLPMDCASPRMINISARFKYASGMLTPVNLSRHDFDLYLEVPLVISPVTYLKASNADAGDHFGVSIDVDGDTVVVGAEGEDSSASGINGNESLNNLNDSGAAYVFVKSAGVWSQQAYIKASIPRATVEFGKSVSISGDTLAIGTNTENAAYVYVRSGTTWSLQQRITPTAPGASPQQFGRRVVVRGDRLWIGDNYSEDGHYYERIGNVWTLHQSFLNRERYFTRGMSFLGGLMAAGAWRGSSGSAGRVYIFEQADLSDPNSWAQVATFVGAASGNNLGRDVAVGLNTVVAGEPQATGGGTAKVYTKTGAVWAQSQVLRASNRNSGDSFGGNSVGGKDDNVDLSGSYLLIGAPEEDSSSTAINLNFTNNSASDAGAAYLFQLVGANWTETHYIKAPNAEARDYFGNSVAVSPNYVLVGAIDEDGGVRGINGNMMDNSRASSGAVYIFETSQLP